MRRERESKKMTTPFRPLLPLCDTTYLVESILVGLDLTFSNSERIR